MAVIEDFIQTMDVMILENSGVVAHRAATRTVKNITGAETITSGASTNKNWIFNNMPKFIATKKEGYMIDADALLLAPVTDTGSINRKDLITVGGSVFSVEETDVYRIQGSGVAIVAGLKRLN